MEENNNDRSYILFVSDSNSVYSFSEVDYILNAINSKCIYI